MTYRSKIPTLAGLTLAGSLAAGSVAVTPTAAQEAITLESLGAVRMARPEEVKRRSDEAVLAQRRAAPVAAVSGLRHAVVAD